MAAFAESVRAYRSFVTPICTPQVVETYRETNRGRDRDFVSSLKATRLEPVYRATVRAEVQRVERTVFECQGPPPPPPGIVDAVPPDRRAAAIRRVQDRWRRDADELPRFFDDGDAAFARMVTARDAALLSRGTE